MIEEQFIKHVELITSMSIDYVIEGKLTRETYLSNLNSIAKVMGYDAGVRLSDGHAESLINLLAWYVGFPSMYHDKTKTDKQGSEKHLTIAYCDELIEALKVKKGSEDEPESSSVKGGS